MEQCFDLHIHSNHSVDGEPTVEQIFASARAHGLSGVAVTDHDTFGGSAEALACAPADLIVIPGIEFSTEYGHMLCYFLRDDPLAAGLRKGKSGFFPFDEVYAFTRAQGALLFAAHPYRGNRFTEELLPRLDGIEMFNGGNTPRHQDANDRAWALAEKHGLPVSAGSDAHTASAVGSGARILDLPPRATLDDVRAGLMRPGGAVWGRYSPAGPLDRWYARSLWQRKRYKKAAKYLMMSVAGTLVYDPFAPVRRSTRAIARGAVIRTGGEGHDPL